MDRVARLEADFREGLDKINTGLEALNDSIWGVVLVAAAVRVLFG